MNHASDESVLASVAQYARLSSRARHCFDRRCKAVALGFALICGQVMAATDLSSAIDLNQHGISGAWYNPASSGQGFVISVMPNIDGAGNSGYFGGWFTYENEGVTTTPAAPMWLTFQGSTANLVAGGPGFTIYENDGKLGRFGELPTVPSTPLGRAYIAMSDCNHMLLHYEVQRGNWIDPPWYDINLVRLLPNVGCVETSNPPFSSFPSYGDVFGNSGAWYDPTTSGQGFVFEINANVTYSNGVFTYGNAVFGGWFTYANDTVPQDQRGRRWYTLQGGPFVEDQNFALPTTGRANVGIFETTGGSFATPNSPDTVISTTKVGTATVVFSTCTDASVSYAFTAGENAGRSSTINLKRLGGVPPECSDYFFW